MRQELPGAFMSAPRILIVYGTTHGQTAKIARNIQEVLEADDFQVVVANAKEKPVPSLSGFHGVIVGASVIARGHQPAVAAFIREHLTTLNEMPSAFFSVSASAGSAREGGRAAARRVRDEFLAETGFTPVISECIAGAIRYTRYNLLLKWYMKRASGKNGGSTDTSRDHEYTDWPQVRNFALAFADLFMLRSQVADMARGSLRENELPSGHALAQEGARQ
jgi:menaquinone-dependent protoporphyrinogen oxidase